MSFVERVNQGESLASWLNWLTVPPAVCWSVIMGDLSASCKGENWALPKAFRTGPGSCAVHNMHHQIGSINLTHYHIFPWLCAWDVCYIIFCHLLHIHSGKTGILFSSLLCILWWVQIFGYVLACRSCSFVYTLHYLIIIIVQTYLRTLNLQNACQICFVECVSKIKHIFSVIHYTIHHHQIGSMSYYPLFRVRSWNNGMRCMHLYILMSAVSADDLATGTMVTKPVSVYVRGTGYIQ